MIDHTKFFKAVLSACCDYYGTNADEVRAKYSARNPPPHPVMMVRGCFIGLLNSIKVPKTEAARFVNITKELANPALKYYSKHPDRPEANQLIATIQSALND